MPDLTDVTRTHSAALKDIWHLAHETFTPELLEQELRDVTQRLTVDTTQRFDAIEREHQALRAQLACTSFDRQSVAQLEQWLDLVVPVLRELADASLRNRTELSNGIVAICDLLDWEVHCAVQLAADDALHQVHQLAAAAGIHYDAWSELHQLIQTHIQNQLKRPDHSRHVTISRN